MLKVEYHSVSDYILSGHTEDYRIERPVYYVNHDGIIAAAVEMIEKFNLDSVDVCGKYTGELLLTVYNEIEDEFDDDVDESFYNPYMGCDCYD